MEKESSNIEEKVKSLEKDVKRLSERNAELEGLVIEYQLKLGINQPPKELGLKDYLSLLYNHSTRDKTLNKLFIIDDARLVNFEFTDSFFSRMISFGYALYVDLSDKDGNVKRFKHFCSKKEKYKFEELLNPLIEKYTKFGVKATSASILFLEGVESDEKYRPFEES